MATTSKTSQALSGVSKATQAISSQVAAGGMTQAQRNTAAAGLQQQVNALQALKASGVSGSQNFAELDAPTLASNQAAQIQQARNAAVITPESVRRPTTIFPAAPIGSDYNALVAGTGIQTADVAQNAIEQSKQNKLDMTKQVYDIIGQPRSVEAEMRASREQQAADQARRMEADLAGQLGQITAQGQAAQLSLVGQGRGIPEAIIGGQQAQIARETAIQALPVSAQLQWAQGNTALAEKTLDRLYQYRSQDIQNEYAYKKDLGTRLLDVAIGAENQKLKSVLDAEEAKTKQAQDNLSYSREMQSMALKTNQSNLVSQFANLDPKSKTFDADMGKIQSKIVDPMFALQRENKQLQNEKLQKEISLLGEPTAAEKKATAIALTEAKASIPVVQGKIDTIDTLLDHSGLSTRVGTTMLTRKPVGASGVIGALASQIGIPSAIVAGYKGLTGEGQAFSGGVHNLTAGLTIQELQDAKARGATFGALSEGELMLLSRAATRLNDWEIKDDKGLGIGVWNIDEGNFKSALKEIQDYSKTALLRHSGTLVDSSEDAALDSAVSKRNNIVTNSNVSGLYQ